MSPKKAADPIDVAEKYEELAQVARELLAETPGSYREMQARDRLAELV